MMNPYHEDRTPSVQLAACFRMRVVCLRKQGESVSLVVEKNGRAYGRDSR